MRLGHGYTTSFRRDLCIPTNLNTSRNNKPQWGSLGVSLSRASSPHLHILFYYALFVFIIFDHWRAAKMIGRKTMQFQHYQISAQQSYHMTSLLPLFYPHDPFATQFSCVSTASFWPLPWALRELSMHGRFWPHRLYLNVWKRVPTSSDGWSVSYFLNTLW